jgi:hypothetical protein
VAGDPNGVRRVELAPAGRADDFLDQHRHA